ncbi:ZNF777 [Branchiostoma lanceolatum]|uniref:ZNF777 protein n=1 Tax=Branchiostoma lanceolatum TaxID=7740 RepID=A0A8K0ELU1_BRALA|nr:ZNF777 [Branchiostoma lanceolatum]
MSIGRISAITDMSRVKGQVLSGTGHLRDEGGQGRGLDCGFRQCIPVADGAWEKRVQSVVCTTVEVSELLTVNWLATIKSYNIILHAFPKNEKVREEWARNVRRTRGPRPGEKVWTPTKSSLLCSAHFSEECFDPVPGIKKMLGLDVRHGRKLLPGVIPSIFPRGSVPATPARRRESRAVEKRRHREIIRELLGPVAQGKSGQTRTPDTQQSVKEEDDHKENFDNADNNITASQLSCGITHCITTAKATIDVKEEPLDELEESLVNCCNNTAQLLSFDTVGTDAEKNGEEKMKLDNCYNASTPSQLSCSAVGTMNCYDTNTLSLQSANPGLTLLPIIVYQPTFSQDASNVSEVCNNLQLPEPNQSRKQVLEPNRAVFPEVLKMIKMDHNNSIDTNSTSSQLKWEVVTDSLEGGEVEKDLSNGNSTVDAKEKDVSEEEDDFDEFEEELSSSEDEKKGYDSDTSWHMSSAEDELFDDSDESVSFCDSDSLEETEWRKQLQRKYNSKRKMKTSWVCECEEKLTSQVSYYKHRLEAHPVTCEYCDEKFRSVGMLQKHMKTHMPGEDRLDLKGNKLYLCDHCGQFFNNKDMKRHEMQLSKARPYKCEVKNCKSSFKEKGQLRNHVRIVHDRSRFPCPYEGCKKTFGIKSTMLKHYRVHTDERSYQCSFCGKMFRRICHLSVHMRIHTGDTPFNCSLCNYSGRQSNCLRWHMKTHHPEHCKKSGAGTGGRPRKEVLLKDAFVDEDQKANGLPKPLLAPRLPDIHSSSKMAPARKSSRKTVQTVTETVVQAPSTPVSRRLTPEDLPTSPLGATPRGALPQVYSTPHKNYDLSEEDLSRIAEEAQSTLRNRASLYTV